MECSIEIAILQSALILADKIHDGGLSKFVHLGWKDEALQVIENVVAEITLGVQQEISPVESQHWKLKLTAILAVTALRHDGLLPCINDDMSALTRGFPPFGLPLFFELVKSCGWTEQLAEVLGMLERSASENLLLSLCRHVMSGDNIEITDEQDVCLMVEMCNLLLLHDNKVVFNSDPRPQCCSTLSEFAQQQVRAHEFLHRNNADRQSGVSEDSVLLTQLLHCLTVVRLGCLPNGHMARLFIALLNLLSCISTERCYVMKRSVVESSEFADSFEDFTSSCDSSGGLGTKDCLEFPIICTSLYKPASEMVAEKVLEILLQMWKLNISCSLWQMLTTENKSEASVSSHERLFLASIMLEVHSQMKHSKGTKSVESSNTVETLSAKLEVMLTPLAEVMSMWMKKQKDLAMASGSPEELERAVFVIDERLEGYIECSQWLASTEDIEVISDKRWLLCIERNLDVFASSPDHLRMLLRRLAQLRLRDNQDAANRLKQVVLRIFLQLPMVLRDNILEDVYKAYEPELLFGVNSDFELQLLATFNRLVNSNKDISKMLSEVSVLALQSPNQTLQKLVLDAFSNTGQVSLLVKIIQGVSIVGSRPSKEGCSCLCEEVKRALRTNQTLTDQERQNQLHCVQLLLQPYTSTCETSILYKKEPILDITEFLHVCVLPHINIVPRSDSPRSSISCSIALALLRVAMETPAMQLCDWTVVERCDLFPTILCLCSVAEVCGSLSEDSALENLYAVKEMALGVLDLLVQILSRQQSPRMSEALQWLRQHMLRLHWTTRLYLHPLFVGCSQAPQSVGRPLSAMLPASLSTLLDVPASVGETVPHVPGMPLLLLFEACKTSDACLEYCVASLRDEAFRSQTLLHENIVTVLVQVLPHCVSAEWTRLSRLLQHLIARDILSARSRIQEQDALISKDDSCTLSQLLKDVVMVYGTACCRQRHQHDKQMCAYVCRGYADVMKNCCIEDSLRVAVDDQQKATRLCLCLVDICTASSTFTPECSSHLQVIAQETAGLFSLEVKKVKVAESIAVTEGSNETSSVMKHIADMVCDAVELVPNEDERETLLKALQ